MATSSSSSSTAPPAHSSFWLEFRVFDDGLDSAAARRMTAVREGGGAGCPPSFSLFPRLPAELRLKIWEYMLAPRIVQVTCFESSSSCESEPSTPTSSSPVPPPSRVGDFASYLSPAAGRGPEPGRGPVSSPRGPPPPLQQQQQQQQVPVLLHVNREARALALEHYELAFAWKVPHVLAVNGVPGSYYYPQNHFHQGPSGLSSSSSFPSSNAPAATATAAAAAAAAVTTTTTTTTTNAATTANNNGNPSASSSSPPPPATAATAATTSLAKTKTPTPQPRPHPPRTGAEAHVYFNFARDMLYLAGELEPHDSFGFNSPMAYFVGRGDAARVRRVAVAFAALGYGETASQQIFGSLFHVVDRFGQQQLRLRQEKIKQMQAQAEVQLRQESWGTHGGAGCRGSGGGGGGEGGGGGRGGGYGGYDRSGEQGHARESRSQTQTRDGGTGTGHSNGVRILIAVTPADEYTHALMGGEGPLVRSPPSSPSPSPSPSPSLPLPLATTGEAAGVDGSSVTQTTTMVTATDGNSGDGERELGQGQEQEQEQETNVVEKIWRSWCRGSIITSSLAGTRFTLVREEDLGQYL